MTTETIQQIKRALDAGLIVTLADSEAYQVIKDNLGQYLIAYNYGFTDASFIGLHGVAGTEYADKINMSGDWIVRGTIKG